MTGQELATAVQEDLAIVVLVVNNGMYGTIRMHQERRYPGRVFAHRPAQPGLRRLRPRVRRARRAGRAHRGVRRRARRGARPAGPALLELRVDPQAITPRQTLDEIREAAGERREVRVDGLAEPISHYADAVVAGDALYISGIVPVDGDGQWSGATTSSPRRAQVFAIMARVLAAAGACRGRTS